MLERFERYPLTFGPTPIEKLDRLGKHLGGKVEIYAKREDCNSGLAFGGNKLRKLEYIIPDAIASDADTLVIVGGVQSNHTRMVAAVAAKIGMKCLLVQESWVPHEDVVYDRVGNILLSRILGAEVRLVDEGFDIGIRHSTVTGSTHAGMIVGFALDGRQRNVIGIDASATPAKTKAQVLSIAQRTAMLVEFGTDLVEADGALLEDYAGPCYGIPSEQTKEAIRLCARLEGMITDPVYEGKSMQGMIDLIQKGFFPAGSRVLFAHLGGAPAINGYGCMFRDG
ncbi:MAG: pyridoxal-phosphate dependent enzyme [Mesorhizobium sp.]|uniref:pyridoxal-phosphate dependent enzyme n=1 Tax=Mesorhizobium sp. TaxID=1871066 RepID=UPI000FE87A64|nr:pyridoxal-phosphate dependent enzyme [Mesorhizobium sp.]RWM51794.1 MAG: pyridoxal-phosphate dependent enzyme [Mesorhizobium sp.]RWM89193.1 MAG: pyridoxal-phosphate dependent enzyme [Mesorhizobium sp.]